MAKRQLPSPEVLRQLLRYEPETGKLFWRPRPLEMFRGGKYAPERSAASWNALYAYNEAFTAINHSGYRVGRIFSQNYRAHLVVWAIAHGEWPTEEIDHINGDPSDNKLMNLRSVTHAENGRNMRRRADNLSGTMGVCWDGRRSMWVVRITVDGRRLYLGSFAKLANAVIARKAAEAAHGFHPNHGRAANMIERTGVRY